VARGDIGQSQLFKESSKKGLSKPMVIGSSKKSYYEANSVSCAGGWTWVIKLIHSGKSIKVRLFWLRKRLLQSWRTSATSSSFFFFRKQMKHFHELLGGKPVFLVYSAWVQPNP
jgi:hypothetical protein